MAHTALRAHFPPANLIGHPPAISPNDGLQNEPPARPASPPQPGNQPPTEARCSN
jgi:hypothetical protein